MAKKKNMIMYIVIALAALYFLQQSGLLKMGLYDDGLVNYYKFDSAGDNVDYSPQGQDITINSGTYNPSCMVGGCYDFDGVSNSMSLVAYNSLSGAQAWTVALWAKKNEVQPNTVAVIRTSNDAVGIYMDENSYGGVVKQEDGTYRITPHDDKNFVGQWVHVVVTYDAVTDGALRIYYNGVKEGADTPVSGQTLIGETTLLIGQEGIGTGYFKGSIDEVMIWDKSLTAAEVAQLYEDQTAAPPECTIDNDCPADTACKDYSCNGGSCESANVNEGGVCTAGNEAGTCQSGTCVANDPEPTPAPSQDYTMYLVIGAVFIGLIMLTQVMK